MVQLIVRRIRTFVLLLVCRHIWDITCSNVWGSGWRATAPCHGSSGSGNMSVHQAEEQDTCCFKGSVLLNALIIKIALHVFRSPTDHTPPQEDIGLKPNPVYGLSTGEKICAVSVMYYEAMCLAAMGINVYDYVLLCRLHPTTGRHLPQAKPSVWDICPMD